jgi:hypothetical protein
MSFLLQRFTNFTAWFLQIETDLTMNKNVQSDIKYRKFNETSNLENYLSITIHEHVYMIYEIQFLSLIC